MSAPLITQITETLKLPAAAVSPSPQMNPAAGTSQVLKAGNKKAEGPLNIFEFTDYREFLKAYYEEKRAKNPSYSMSAFTRRAGLGANSRGYLKLIIEGKRNLTPHTLRSFSDALGLSPKEALYFENLVFFNQARTNKDKEYYFGRLSAASEGKETAQFEILRSQYAYCTHWYLVAVRELVDLADFQEDSAWISQRLRGKITRKEASEAIEHLLRMGLLRRENGKLVQSQPLVKFQGGVFNLMIQNYHQQMIDLAKESLVNDEYDERSASGVTLSCDASRLPAILAAISRFRDELTTEFGVGNKAPDAVIQVNLQTFQLTTPKGRSKNSKDKTK